MTPQEKALKKGIVKKIDKNFKGNPVAEKLRSHSQSVRLENQASKAR